MPCALFAALTGALAHFVPAGPYGFLSVAHLLSLALAGGSLVLLLPFSLLIGRWAIGKSIYLANGILVLIGYSFWSLAPL